MSLLSVTGLEVRRDRRPVLHGVSLTLADGEVMAVLGPNGAGKSTLIGAIGGLLPHHRGEVRCEGRAATVLQTAGLAHRSVRANVDLAQAWWGVPRRERRERTAAALTAMGADHLARRFAGALSGGEARRVHLARGVAVRPDVLLLDEPFAGLDAATRAALVEDTASALRQAARATLVVLHERSDAWALADRVVVLLDGRVAAEGAPDALLREPPTPDVARFLGYDGVLETSDGTLMTRAPWVRVAPDGEREARVVRRLRREDGVLLDLALDQGTLRCLHADPQVPDLVRVTLDHVVRF